MNMPEEPTNAVLATKIDSLRELMEVKFEQNRRDHQIMNEHFKMINGQISKNTEFRVKGSVYAAVVIFVASVIFSILLQYIISYKI